ncbi:MAG: thioredoxin family protein [Balneolaceae bacterium]
MAFNPEIHAQSDPLVGATTLEEISRTEKTFRVYMDRYHPNEDALKHLSSVQDSITLYAFIGTWCRESKKYIPGLVKTLDVAANPFITLKFIGVDAQKKFPETFLKTFDIKYIPTVVVLKGDVEIGRIDEAPQQLIEIELVNILNKNGIY